MTAGNSNVSKYPNTTNVAWSPLPKKNNKKNKNNNKKSSIQKYMDERYDAIERLNE